MFFDVNRTGLRKEIFSRMRNLFNFLSHETSFPVPPVLPRIKLNLVESSSTFSYFGAGQDKNPVQLTPRKGQVEIHLKAFLTL